MYTRTYTEDSGHAPSVHEYSDDGPHSMSGTTGTRSRGSQQIVLLLTIAAANSSDLLSAELVGCSPQV